MAQRAPDGRPQPPTTAVVQVAENGTARLYLGSELVEHANGVDPATVMGILVDYAATIDTPIRVTTQMAGGTWTRHLLNPDATTTEVPLNVPAVQQPALHAAVDAQWASLSPRRTVMRARVASRAPFLAALLLLGAMFVAAAILGAS